MAVVYPHNPVNSRDSSRDENSEITEHSRNLSTISSATLLTNISSHSQPNEPLLPSLKSPESASTYYDHSPRQTRPREGSESQLRWTEPLAACPEPNDDSEKSRSTRKWNRKRWKRRRRIEWTLELIIGAWGVYNAIRYFLAFNVYGRDASTGQVICLALGTSAGVSCALTFFASLVSNTKRNHLYLSRIYPIMRYLSSFCLFAPTVVNLIFVFLWRNSPNSRYNLHFRCHIDIDVFWTITTSPCSKETYSWGLWVLSTFLRFGVTLLVLSTYHIIVFLYPEPPRPLMHHRLRSGSGSENLYSPQSTPVGERPSLSILMSHQDLRAQHHPSDVSLDGATLRDDYPPLGRIRLARSRSSGLSIETTQGETQSLGRKHSSSTENEVKPDQNSFADRFRSILSQISQETDDAVAYARTASPEKLTSNNPSPSGPPIYSRDDYDDESDDEQDIHEQLRGRHSHNVYNLPPVPPALGYNEFGLPYPPDQDVRMLNGYIRRMPTIESMGSGEIASSIGASSIRQGGGGSRPPTRNTLLSIVSTEYDMAASNPPSRTNSLSARAEYLLSPPNGTSEHGELLGRSESAIRRISSPNSFVESPLGGSPVVDTFSSSTTGSRATTMSYHTATTGSSTEPPYAPSLDTTPRPSRTREYDHDTQYEH